MVSKGFGPARWSCARLAEEALYLETRAARFELLGEGAGFVLSRLRDPALAAVPVAEEAKVSREEGERDAVADCAPQETVARAENWQGVVWRGDGVAMGGTVLAGVLALRWERFTGVAYV